MIKKIVKGMIALIIALFLTTNMLYAQSNVTFLNKADEFIVSPLDKDLFTNFKDVMPGDTLVQPITVENDGGNDFAIKMYMRVYPIAEEYMDFLSQMTMTLENDGVVFYQDTIDQTMALEEYILLAELKPGEFINLDVTLEVPLALNNEYADMLGELDWEFMLEEIEAPPEVLDREPKEPEVLDRTPTTGIAVNALPYLVLAGVSSVVLVSSRRRSKK